MDQLGLLILRHFDQTDEWNLRNFTVSEWFLRQPDATRRVLIEGIDWLLHNGLVASLHPGQDAAHSTFITRAGRDALQNGLRRPVAAHRLSVALHPRLERVRTQFLLGEYELAAFAALREVEIRVRELAGADASKLGVTLMREAWRPENGALMDPALDAGERVGLMELFSGAIGTFKNPPSHRQINYDDPTEASEVVLLADLLLRLLDRTARRLGKA